MITLRTPRTASGVQFFIAVLGRESHIFVNFASPKAPKSDESAIARAMPTGM